MTKAMYVGLDNTYKAKRLYVGIDGKARKVKRAYIGVNNEAKPFYLGYGKVTVIQPEHGQLILNYANSEYTTNFEAEAGSLVEILCTPDEKVVVDEFILNGDFDNFYWVTLDGMHGKVQAKYNGVIYQSEPYATTKFLAKEGSLIEIQGFPPTIDTSLGESYVVMGSYVQYKINSEYFSEDFTENGEYQENDEKKAFIVKGDTQVGISYEKRYSCCVPVYSYVENLNGKLTAGDLEVGDTIYGFNFETNQVEKTVIYGVSKPIRDTIIVVNTEQNGKLEYTDNHAVWTNQGWAAYRPERCKEVEAIQLCTEQKVYMKGVGYVQILSITEEPRPSTECRDFSTSLQNYFANGILVHNVPYC